MARWHAIPVLAGILVAGAFQPHHSAAAQAKPGAAEQTPSYERPVPRRRVARAPAQDYVAPVPAFEAPAPLYSGRPGLRPSPRDPYSGVTLPRQSGDAAYQGGGVVLEQDDSGVNRRIR